MSEIKDYLNKLLSENLDEAKSHTDSFDFFNTYEQFKNQFEGLAKALDGQDMDVGDEKVILAEIKKLTTDVRQLGMKLMKLDDKINDAMEW